MLDPEYSSYVEKGSQASPRTFLSFNDTLGKEITRYINDPDYARRYRADDYNYQDVKRLDKLTDDEKNVIRAMASKGDYEGIEGYYGLIERDLNERVQNERNEKARELSYDHPVLAGVGNVASSFATPFAFFENAGQAIKNKITGEYVPTDINSPAFAATHFGEQSEDGITERVYDAVGGGRVGDIASNVTSGILSGLSDAPKYALGPLGIGLMALDAAGESTHTALKNGSDPSEAFLLSSVDGLATGMSRKIPIDVAVKTLQNEFVLNDGKNYNAYVKEGIENGMSGAGAELAALAKIVGPEMMKEIVADVAQRGAISFLSKLFS